MSAPTPPLNSASAPDTPEKTSQFQLLSQRRFGPLFATQFLGAFNDNVFKNALIVLLVFSTAASEPDNAHVLVNMAAGLFILPFFLFSATAGQLADKYDKARLVRVIKLAEVGVMLAGAFALLLESTAALLGVLFLLGMQSTFFGPVKYAILPQVLKEEELVGGNAQVEMGTFVAILLGTILGGLLAGFPQARLLLSGVIIAVALLGWLCSRAIPRLAATDPELSIGWNPVRQTWQMLRLSRQRKSVFLSILGISWFWLIGSAYLIQFPAYTKEILQGDNTVVTLLLCTFTVGIALGSLLCERMSGSKIEMGLVPFGSLGLSLFGIDLFFASTAYQGVDVMGAWTFLAQPGAARVLLDLALIGMFGGFYIVPLYAVIQSRTPEKHRARVIAVNNILNALFMVISSLFGGWLLGGLNFTIPDFFLLLALINIAVAVFIYHQVPEFTMRFLIWLLSHTLYRVKHKGLEVVPEKGGAMIVCNHVSYVDALLLAGAVRRPIRFIMYKPIYELPVLNFIFRVGGAIPIISQHADKVAYDRAMEDIEQGLKQGDLLCIFPEGKLTQDGEMSEFKTGIERILEKTPVPVIPMGLRGLWGSFFSHRGGNALTTWPRRFWSKVDVVAGDILPAEGAKAPMLHARVKALVEGS